MDELRLILLGAGVLVVAGVYAHSRFMRRNRDENAGRGKDGAGGRREPDVGTSAHEDMDDDLPSLRADEPGLLQETDDARAGDSEVRHATGQDAQRKSPTGKKPVTGKEKLIVLNILPVEPEGRFRGNDLLEVFDRAGLEYGRFDVFHRMIETPDGIASVFSVASATEPGSFDISEMADESFKGLTMFMLLPGPQGGVAAFADMLATARRMAQQLGADVTDRNRSSMTRQTAHHIREDIIAFEHQFRRESERPG